MIANDYWEACLPTDFIRPNENTSSNEVLFFIKNKYVRKLYVDPNVENPVSLILEGRFKFKNKEEKATPITQKASKNEGISRKIDEKEMKNKSVTEKCPPIQISQINEDLIYVFEGNDAKVTNKGNNISLKINSDNNIISNNSLDTRTILNLYKDDGKNGSSKESAQNKYAAFEKLPLGVKVNSTNPLHPYAPLMVGKNSNPYSNSLNSAISSDFFISKDTSNSNMVKAPIKNGDHYNSLAKGSKNHSKKEGAFDDLLAFV